MNSKLTYIVLYEREGETYGAYLADVPGCIATSNNLDDLKRRIKNALHSHIQAMRDRGEPLPEATIVAAEFLVVEE